MAKVLSFEAPPAPPPARRACDWCKRDFISHQWDDGCESYCDYTCAVNAQPEKTCKNQGGIA